MNFLLKRICPLILFFTINIFTAAYGQSVKEYSFAPSQNKQANNNHNKILVVDSRSNKSNLGMVQTGLMNSRTIVVAKPGLQEQFNSIMANAVTDTSANSELLIQLHQLCFNEITKFSREEGYFYFRAGLYAKQDSGYAKIKSIDTVLVLSKIDVTNATLKAAREMVTDFITTDLNKAPISSRLISYNDIAKVDSITKSRIYVYNTDNYADGIYLSYQSFSKQIPDAQVVLKNNQLSKKTVFKLDKDGNSEKVLPEQVYAIVYGSKPYIATAYGYYPLSKKDNDFVFTGKLPLSKGQLGSAMAFGAVGVLVASSSNPTWDVKIDYTNGDFILLNEAVDPNAIAAKSPDYYEH